MSRCTRANGSASSSKRVGIPVYCYVVELRRPHGALKTGLSRDRYEDVTKDIRFRMYERCFELCSKVKGGDKSFNCVMLGHHQDDVDENRI